MKKLLFTLLIVGIFAFCTSCNKKDYLYHCSARIVKFTQNPFVEETFQSKAEADKFCSDLESDPDPDIIEVQDCMCEKEEK